MLEQALAILEHATYKGVSHVHCVEGAEAGPTLVIFMGTHGNEPVGLYAFMHFYEYFSQHTLTRGRILFILSNPAAVQRYAAAQNDEERRMARFVDINMNRLPLESHLTQSTAYEVRRLQEIYPLLQDADMALDLHSTSLPSDPMIIPLLHTEERLLHALPVETIVSNVTNVIGNLFLLSYVGGFLNKTSQCALIECGLHEDPASINHAVNSVRGVLHAYAMHDFPGAAAVPKKVYEMVTSVFFPHDSYRLVRDFGNFEPVLHNEILATGEGDHIFAPHEGHALFAFKGGRPPSIEEEAMFLTLPARELLPN